MKLIIIKVGTAVLVKTNGELDYTRIATIIRDIAELRQQNYQVALVTSGAVAAGSLKNAHFKGISKKTKKSLSFSIGQPKLMRFYSDIAIQHGINIAQVLVSRKSFSNRSNYFNIRDTLNGLLNNSILPIINNDDFVQTKEIDFSDNDHLASFLAGMLNAHKVFFLTTVDGLYENFGQTSKQKLITQITNNLENIDCLVKPLQQGQSLGTGGMASKLSAAKLLFELGINSYIANGTVNSVVSNVLFNNLNCTKFIPKKRKKLSGIRKWLCTGAIPNGGITISEKGSTAINHQNSRCSLLAKGVLSIEGTFQKDDVICINNQNKTLIGYGISKFSSQQLTDIMGNKNHVVIHADHFFGFNSFFD